MAVSLQWWIRLSSIFSLDPAHRDCVLHCGEGGKQEVHRLVLALASPLLAEILEDDQEDAVILLPEVQAEVVTQLVSLLYTGNKPEPMLFDDVGCLARDLGVKTSCMDNLEEEEEVEEETSYLEENTTFLYVEEAKYETMTVEDTGNYAVEVRIGGSQEDSERLLENISVTKVEEEEDNVVIQPLDCSSFPVKKEEMRTVIDNISSAFREVSVQSCSVCLKPIPSHKQGKHYLCCQCDLANLSSVRALLRHVRSHCKLLQESPPEEAAVNLVKMSKTKSVEGVGGPSPKMQCPSCFKVLSTRHYEKYHRAACTGEVVLTCTLCGRKGFCTAATLQDHIRARHTAERPYKCDLCGKDFPATSHLAHHRMKKHNVNSKGETQPKVTFPCMDCGKVLTTKPKLQAHMRVIHQGIKSFSCSQCAKSFSSKSNLEIHIGSAHTGVLPYKCSLCTKSFSRKSSLVTHHSTHNFSEGIIAPSVTV